MWPFTRTSKNEKKRGPIETSLAFSRAFAAAEISGILGPWTFDGGFSNSEIAAALASLRQRCRDMQKNSEYFHRWIQLFKANVAGPNGFRFKSTAERSDTDHEVDEKAAYFIETHWQRWAADSRAVDQSGILDLPAILRLAVENWARDGEAFIIIDRAAQNEYGISLRVIRPDCCDETLNVSLGNGRRIEMGVEYDVATKRRIAYHFNAAKEDTSATYFGGRPRVRIPASSVIHLFTPHDAGQLRGVPLGHAAIRALKMLDEYRFSELVAARDNTNTLGFFTAPLGRDGEIEPLANDDRIRGRLESMSEPGQKTILKPGWDYKWSHPEHPNVNLAPFEAAVLRSVASALGVEYANFANNWAAVSYSSVRAGTLAERDQWMTFQAELVNRVLNPLFDAWLQSFLSLRVSGGKYTPADFERLRPHDFIGRRWQWVDPMKDVNASILAIRNGLTSQSRVAAEYGGDADEIIKENARISAELDEAGIYNPFRSSVPSAAADGGDSDNKENNEQAKE